MSPIHFHTALGGSILRLWRGPSPRAYSWSGVLSFPFIPLRGSILRLWSAPSPRAYSWSGFTLLSFYTASRIHPAPLARPFSKGLLMEQIHSLSLSFRLEDSSCAFGAALLQGPTHGTESLSFPFIPLRGSILRLRRGPSPRAYSWNGVSLFSFHSASRIHPAPSARPFSKGLLMERSLSLFLLYRFEESILRLWRSPFPRAYSWSRLTLFSFHSASRIHPAPLARPFFKGLLNYQNSFLSPEPQSPVTSHQKRKRASFR